MEHPCHHCKKGKTCGATCSTYRFYLANQAGEHFRRRAAEAARGIKERREKDELPDSS